MSRNLDGGSVGKVAHKIYKMAYLTQNPATTLFWIIHPMVGRKTACIDAIVHRQGLVHSDEKGFQLDCQWSKAAIESEHRQRLSF